MAPRTQTHKPDEKPYKRLSKRNVFLCVFSSTLIIALMSFISIELAVLGFGVMMMAAVIFIEARHRDWWELGAHFKFKSLRETQKNHEDEIAKNTYDIAGLKADVVVMKSAIERMKTPKAPMPSRAEVTAPAPKASTSDLMAFLKQEETKTPDMPRAIKPAAIPDDYYEDEPTPMQEPQDEFESLSDTVVRELLHHAVKNKRVDVFVQPIMRLPQRQTRFFEMFARIRARPGQYLPASRYQKIAEQDNLQDEIDYMLLLQCIKTIQESAHIEKAAPFFINVTASTLKNLIFMKRLLIFLSHNRILAPRLVFELPQHEFSTLPASIIEIIKGLGKLGCAFSLDHVMHMEFDVAVMQAHKIRFVKIGADYLTRSMEHEKSAVDLQRAKRILESNGIGVIIEKIETEKELRSLLDFEIHFGQGWLFGRPELQGAYANRARKHRVETKIAK